MPAYTRSGISPISPHRRDTGAGGQGQKDQGPGRTAQQIDAMDRRRWRLMAAPAEKTYKSQQEELAARMCRFSFGASFVFTPDDWHQGKSTGEPADVVWAANECVILMYMKAAKVSHAPERARRKREEAIKGNLAQAKGWLREWRQRRPLTGHNERHTFQIAFPNANQAYRHVVVLSLAEYGSPVARYHHLEARDMAISLCATIPISVIDALARRHASMLDLLAYLVLLRSSNRDEFSEDEALRLVDGYTTLAWQRSEAETHWPRRMVDNSFVETTNLVRGARIGSTVFPQPTDADCLEPIAEVFSDLPLVDYLNLVTRLRAAVDSAHRQKQFLPSSDFHFINMPVTSVPTHSLYDAPIRMPPILHHVPLTYYDFTLSIEMDYSNPAETTPATLSYAYAHTRGRWKGKGLIGGPVIQWTLAVPILWTRDRLRPSATLELLDSCQSAETQESIRNALITYLGVDVLAIL